VQVCIVGKSVVMMARDMCGPDLSLFVLESMRSSRIITEDLIMPSDTTSNKY